MVLTVADPDQATTGVSFCFIDEFYLTAWDAHKDSSASFVASRYFAIYPIGYWLDFTPAPLTNL